MSWELFVPSCVMSIAKLLFKELLSPNPGWPGQGWSGSFWSFVDPHTYEWRGLRHSKCSINVSCYYHHYLRAIVIIILLFIIETVNRDAALIHLMCVCTAFNHTLLNSPKVLFTGMTNNQTIAVFLISICTFIFESIASRAVLVFWGKVFLPCT